MVLNRTSKISLALLTGVGLAALIAWTQREPIARSLIDDTLREAGVDGRYEIEGLGTQKQRLTGIVLGNPSRPDLTADWAEIDTGWSLDGAQVRAIRLGNVHVRGRLANGTLSLGSLDKLLPEPDGEPFRLPSYDVAVSNGRMTLDTIAGRIGIVVRGSGRLDTGFDGRIAMAAPALSSGGCGAVGTALDGTFSTRGGKPHFVGPVRINSIRCDAVSTNALSADVDLTSDVDFKSFDLKSNLNLASVQASSVRASGTSGTLTARGTAKAVDGRLDMTLATFDHAQARAKDVRLVGPFTVRDGAKGWSMASEGQLKATHLVPGQALLSRVQGLGGGESGSPLAPLVNAFKQALSGLGRGSALDARYVLSQQPGSGSVQLSALRLASRSGMKVALNGTAPLHIGWPDLSYYLGGSATISGGGFPTISARFNGEPDTFAGIAVMTPWRADDSRLALSPARFNWSDAGLFFTTRATLDGPLGNGRIEGLTLPLTLLPGQTMLAGCFTPQVKRLSIDALTVQNASLLACLDGAAADIRPFALTGTLSGTPLTLSGGGARFSFAKGDFSARTIEARLGRGEDMSLLAIAVLKGSTARNGASGQFSGLSGRLANVPLRMSEGQGRWSFAGGNLALTSQIKIADASSEPRFYPLFSPDFTLNMADGLISARGTLAHPARGVEIGNVTLSHRLSSGTGEAMIAMPGLTFGQAIQPEELTPVTLGVIANVEGAVSGQGLIKWSPDGVTSSGEFGSGNLNMAAAFGPVSGLRGRVSFSDLLNLETGSVQTVSLASINPGIAVTDGVISFRLLPGLKAQIEGGRWPFAGGWLVLEPTVLDLNQAAERRLTFRVEDLDAARFIAAMEFENISATGRFDGTLPMVFDARGGRIEGGKLVAQGGGTLSYVGEVSNGDLGMMSRIAFDALKALKYDRLSIDLDGEIDGDVITRIRFAGVNQAPIEGVRAKLPIPIRVTGLSNFPFIFNVTITAKFRQLFEMARSFNDPSVLINRIVPQLEPVPGEKARPVQPSERQQVP